MASLLDLVEKLKKSIGQGVQTVQQNAPRVMQSYANTYSKVAPFVPFAPQVTTPQQVQRNYRNTFFAIPNAQTSIQNFAQRNPGIANTLLKAEPFVNKISSFMQQPYKPVSLPSAQTRSPVANVGYNFLVKPVAEGLINAPTNYIGGITKTGMDIGKMSNGEKVPVRKLLGDIGQTGGAIMDMSMLPVGAGAVKNVAASAGRNTLKSSMVHGGLEGLKFGGTYGLLSALKNNQDVENLKTYAKNVLGETAQGGLAGGVFGATAGGLSYGAGKLFNSIAGAYRKAFPKASDQEASTAAKAFIRDELGRFSRQEMPKKEPQFYGDMREALGLPRNGEGMPSIGMTTRAKGGSEAIAKAEAAKKLPGIMFTTSKTKAEGKPNVDAFLEDLAVYQEKIGKNNAGDSSVPAYTNAQMNELIAKANFKSSEDKANFKKIFSEWIGRREAGKTRGVEIGSKLQTPKGLRGQDLISYIENPTDNAPKDVVKFTEKVRAQYDNLFKEAKAQGMDIRYLKDYITHIWDRPQEQVAQLYRSAKGRFGFAKDRTLPTYAEGIQIGLKPKYTEPSQIISEYTKRLEQAQANIDIIKALKKEGYIVQKKTPGFIPITAPGFNSPKIQLGDGAFREGVYYAPKDIADSINRVFSEQKSRLNIPAKISGGIQDITMSGGVPKTPINAWTTAQVIKEVTAGRIRGPLKALWTSLSEGGSNKYFSENAQFIREQQLNNIPISTTLNTESLAPRGTIEKVFGKNIQDAWTKTVNEPTFKRFMPILQTEFYKDVRNSALSAGRSQTEAMQIASQATKNFYGLTSTADTALRNKGVSDAVSTFLFAPRYRESMINFWVNNLKSLKNPLALENRANVKFLVGAALTAVAYDQLNRKFTGHSILENPPGTEDKLLVPDGQGGFIGVPYLSSIATMPRAILRQGIRIAKGDLAGAAKDAGQSYLSMGIKPLADLAANEDYFGKAIVQDNMTTGEKFGAQGAYLFKQYVLAHPYLKELATGGGDPAYQRLSRAMELPFRFYSQKQLDTKTYYGAKDSTIQGLSDVEKKAFDSIPKADESDPNTRILKYQIYLTYPSVFAAKQKIELETAAKTGKAIDPLYLVDYETAKKYMRYEALPEGSQDRKDMTKAYPELTALFDTRSKYFDENPIPGQKSSQRPMPSAYVQQQMDAKNWLDPQVRAYLDANTQWNNQQREKLGLPPLNGFTPYAKKPKKISIKKVSMPKVKLAKASKKFKFKAAKMPKIKISKIKTPKIKLTKS